MGQPQASNENPDINNKGDGLISTEAKERFKEMRGQLVPNWKNLVPNELWIKERYAISAFFSQYYNYGYIHGSDDIARDEEVKREIRKSIITGLTYKNQNDEL